MTGAGFYFLLGAIAGGALAWWLAGRGRQRLGEQIAGEIQSALPRMAEAVLAPKAQELERAAGQELKLLGSETVSRVETSQAGLQAKLEEMRLRLESYQARLNDLDTQRAGEQARIEQQIARVAAAGADMTQEARSLRAALATSGGVRGRWGEEVLANLLNASGLNANLDYQLQLGLEAGDNRLRPDAIIHLPSGRNLAIDAKASLAAFLDGVEQHEESGRRAAYARFAQVLRARAKELASREYSRHLSDSLPCVVMFIPSESAFRAALDADPELFLHGQAQQPAVVLASPSTLLPLLTIVAQGWQQHQASQEMHKLTAEIQEMGKRLQIFLGHLQSVGKGIDAAGKAYNSALASYNSRLAPQQEKVRALGGGWAEPEPLKPIENRPLLAEAAEAEGSAPPLQRRRVQPE